MKKDNWQIAKPIIIKSFLILVLLPLSVFAGCAVLALVVGDKNVLWKPILGGAVISLFWGIAGVWKFNKIVSSSLSLTKAQSKILLIIFAILAIGVFVLINELIVRWEIKK